MRITNLNKRELAKTFRRLRKDTNGFTSLIVREPLDYLDYEINLFAYLESLVNDINKSNYTPSKPYYHSYAKSKGINRPTVVLNLNDALVYRFCIEQIEGDLFKNMRQKNIRGGIKITANKNPVNDGDFYEKWFEDWMAHQENLKNSTQRKDFFVVTDIASYFENINMLVLKDSIRSTVKGKKNLLNLLFYFLESTKTRPKYEVNTFTGLLQESIDVSRIMAYYFLSPHDEKIARFCDEYSAEYYRYVDDMTIAVDNETTGRHALKTVVESLRELNLVASIRKTKILSKEQLSAELFFDENAYLNDLESEILEALVGGKDLSNYQRKLEEYYKKLIQEDKTKQANWIKIIKRFFTLSIYSKSDFLLNNLEEFLIYYPLILCDKKLSKYLLSITDTNRLQIVIKKLIVYLRSNENLYSVLETNILESLILIPVDKYSAENQEEIVRLADDILFSKNDYNSNSDYARALSVLILYKFDKKVEEISKHYLNSQEDDTLLRKYLIFVSLTATNHKIRKGVLQKAQKEQSQTIYRLIQFIHNLSNYSGQSIINRYLDKNKLVLCYKPDMDLIVEEDIDHVRGRILKNLIEIYG